MAIKTYKDLLKSVEKVSAGKNLDLSSGEDLSIGIMNLISIEEHLFFTYGKLKNPKFLKLLNEIRKMRTELMREIVKEPEGEVWCISKHLLAASMRVMEVGTKELKKAEALRGPERAKRVEGAENLFKKSYDLYSLFWGLNLSNSKFPKSPNNPKATFIDEKGREKGSTSVFSKFESLVQKAIDCCIE